MLRHFSAYVLIISIHTLHTEGDLVFPVPPFDTLTISIHTLHTEGDTNRNASPTSPLVISIHTLHTEGDSVQMDIFGPVKISIHTLHTEGDIVHIGRRPYCPNFNPHPPHGG